MEEGGNRATTRWSAEETRRRVAEAPPLRWPPPDESTLQDNVLGYAQITRDPVSRPKKRNLVATCYRLHGPKFLDRVQTWYVAHGSATNLLGFLRINTPEMLDALEAALHVGDELNEPEPVIDPAQADVVIEDPPASDGEPPRSDDGRQWDPDAGFFSHEELRSMPRRSPTAQALDR